MLLRMLSKGLRDQNLGISDYDFAGFVWLQSVSLNHWRRAEKIFG
jgi:hypothetical protein